MIKLNSVGGKRMREYPWKVQMRVLHPDLSAVPGDFVIQTDGNDRPSGGHVCDSESVVRCVKYR